MSDDHLMPFYDELARKPSIEAAVALAAAIAEAALGETDFKGERLRIHEHFAEQRETIRRCDGDIPPDVKLFSEDKLYELRQWLSFLRHSYTASGAGFKVEEEVLRAGIAVGRIHSFRLEQAGRGMGRHGDALVRTRQALDQSGPALLALKRDTARNTLSLSRVAFRKVRLGLRRVRLRSLGRFVRRHAFLWVGGFFVASYLLGALPDAVRLPFGETGNLVTGLILAGVVWGLDRWVLGPWVDRRFKEYRKADAEADLADLEDAYLWAHMCRVFSASVLQNVLDSTEAEYKNTVKALTDRIRPVVWFLAC